MPVPVPVLPEHRTVRLDYMHFSVLLRRTSGSTLEPRRPLRRPFTACCSSNTPAVDLLIMEGRRLGGGSGWRGRGIGVAAAIWTRPPARRVGVPVRGPGG